MSLRRLHLALAQVFLLVFIFSPSTERCHGLPLAEGPCSQQDQGRMLGARSACGLNTPKARDGIGRSLICKLSARRSYFQALKS